LNEATVNVRFFPASIAIARAPGRFARQGFGTACFALARSTRIGWAAICFFTGR